MLKLNKQVVDGSKIFDFYTYDPTGKDVVIPIVANSEEEAWVHFENVYHSYVDMMVARVLEHKNQS